MEVNVDTLEQVELIDLGDQDGADVFLPCEDPPPTPQTSGMPLCFGPMGTGRSELNVKAGLQIPNPNLSEGPTALVFNFLFLKSM